MHEASLVAGLVRRAVQAARDEGAARVTRVRVELGELCHLDAGALRTHFAAASAGTVAEGAALEVVPLAGIDHPRAQDLVLRSVDVEVR